MENITESDLFLPTVKRVGESLITYSVEKYGDSYSLAVSSTALFEGSAFVHDITQDRAAAERIKNLFADNLVSPLHTLDVLEDFLADNCI